MAREESERLIDTEGLEKVDNAKKLSRILLGGAVANATVAVAAHATGNYDTSQASGIISAILTVNALYSEKVRRRIKREISENFGQEICDLRVQGQVDKEMIDFLYQDALEHGLSSESIFNGYIARQYEYEVGIVEVDTPDTTSAK